MLIHDRHVNSFSLFITWITLPHESHRTYAKHHQCTMLWQKRRKAKQTIVTAVTGFDFSGDWINNSLLRAVVCFPSLHASTLFFSWHHFSLSGFVLFFNYSEDPGPLNERPTALCIGLSSYLRGLNMKRRPLSFINELNFIPCSSRVYESNTCKPVRKLQ